MWTSQLPLSAAILPTRLNCSMARTTGAQCSTVPPASTSTDTTEFRSPTSTTTVLTISTSASLPAYPIASIAIAAMAPSKTLRNRLALGSWRTRLARSSLTSITMDARTSSSSAPVVRCYFSMKVAASFGKRPMRSNSRTLRREPSQAQLLGLRSRRVARRLLLPICLLSGDRPIQISFALSRCRERSAEFSDAQQRRRHVPRRYRRVGTESKQHTVQFLLRVGRLQPQRLARSLRRERFWPKESIPQQWQRDVHRCCCGGGGRRRRRWDEHLLARLRQRWRGRSLRREYVDRGR